jgi:predicted kinase
VLAKTSLVASALQSDPARGAGLVELAREYLAMALDLLRPPAPRLVAIGGFSGSGKSALARLLAPRLGAAPGAALLRSDQARKRLAGVPELVHLGTEGYAPEVSRRVYETLTERAARVTAAGHSAIVDAVFARPENRSAIEAAAGAAGVPFVGLWLEAPEQVLVERVRRREQDASDADASVVRAQLAESTGPVSWQRIDAAAGLEEVLARAISVLGRQGVRIDDR